MKNTTNINAVIKEIKEYQAMQKDLEKQIDELKAESERERDSRVLVRRRQDHIQRGNLQTLCFHRI